MGRAVELASSKQRRTAGGARRKAAASARWRGAPALIAVLTLVIQWLMLPLHHPAVAANASERLADLQAATSVAVSLCESAPAGRLRHAPLTSCQSACPLCQFAGQTALLLPEMPALPEARLSGPVALGTPSLADPPATFRRESARPRAPPFAV
jgi:hypothetical protein